MFSTKALVVILTEVPDTAVESDGLALHHLVGPALAAEVRTGGRLQTTAGVSDTFTELVISTSAQFVSHLFIAFRHFLVEKSRKETLLPSPIIGLAGNEGLR